MECKMDHRLHWIYDEISNPSIRARYGAMYRPYCVLFCHKRQLNFKASLAVSSGLQLILATEMELEVMRPSPVLRACWINQLFISNAVVSLGIYIYIYILV